MRKLHTSGSDRSRLSRYLPAMVFLATTFVYLALPLLGLRTFGAVDLHEGGDPYRSALQREPHIESPIQTDQVEIFPYIVSMAEGIRDLDYRMWEPSVAGGTPLGILPTWLIASPFNVGFLFLPGWYAIGFKVALQFLFAQTFMYLFLRLLGVRRGPAIIGAVAYTFSGANIIHIHRMTAPLVLPAALWAFTRLVRKPSLWIAAAAAGSVAWLWLEGFPAAWLFSLYALAAWVAWLAFTDLGPLLRRFGWSGAARFLVGRAAWAFGAVAGGVALIAFNFIPLLYELEARGILETRPAGGNLPSIQVFGLFDGLALGRWKETLDWWTGNNPVESVTFLGLIVAFGVLGGLIAVVLGRLRMSRLGQRAWAFFSILAISVVIASFFSTPLGDAFYALPGLERNPIHRSRFLIGLAAAVLLSLALDALWKKRGRRPSFGLRVGSAFVLAVATGLLVWTYPDYVRAARAAGEARAVAWSVLIGLALTALFALLWLRGRSRPGWRSGLTVVAVVVLAVQLMPPFQSFTPAAPIDAFYSATAAHRALDGLNDGNHRFAATGLTTFYPNGSLLHETPDLRGLALHDPDFRELLTAMNPNAFVRDPLKVFLARDEWDLASPVLDHLAVGYFALDTRETPYGRPETFDATDVGVLAEGSVPLALEDVDGDGVDELITRSEFSPDALHVIDLTTETWSAISIPPLESPIVDLVAGDFNGDRHRELVLFTASGSTEVLTSSGTPISLGAISASPSPRAAAAEEPNTAADLLVTAPGPGVPPEVRVHHMGTTEPFLAYAPDFDGGVSIAVADVSEWPGLEIVTGAGPGGGPHVRVFDLAGRLLNEFFAFDMNYYGGIDVATADVTNDGLAEIAVRQLDDGRAVALFRADGTPLGAPPVHRDQPARFVAGGSLNTAGDETFVMVEPTAAVLAIQPIADAWWSSWVPATGAIGRSDLVAPGPIVGLYVPLRVEPECSGSKLTVSLKSPDGTVTTSARQAFDVNEGWVSFAIDGQKLRAGDAYSVEVQPSPACRYEAGVNTGGDLAVQPLIPDPEVPVRLASTESMWLYERPSAWDLISTHDSWAQVATIDEAIATLGGAAVPVIGAAPTTTNGTAAIVEGAVIDSDGARFSTRGSGDTLAVYSQNADEHWTVTIDGRDAEIVLVDGALLGVFVPPGEHEVEFRYRPNHFRLGVMISIAAALGIAVALGIDWLRRRRKNRG